MQNFGKRKGESQIGTFIVFTNKINSIVKKGAGSLRIPKIFNLRRDPYELADRTSNVYWDWLLDHAFVLVPAQAYVGQFLATFKDYPPRQKAASFSIDQVLEMMQEAPNS